MNTSWLDDCTLYQFYPLGFCDAPHENSWDWSNTWNAATRPVKRIDRVLAWIDHMKKLNVTAVHFNAMMQSDTHGYNTRDFYTLDSRLGSNEDFAEVCKVLHNNGLRVVMDAHFNHVGRGFWAFRDVREKLQDSKYIGWFKEIDFDRNTPCCDGFYYKAYLDNWDFPELNLENEELIQHIFGAIRKWNDMFSIDGLRIGIVNLLNQEFVERLRAFCSNISAGLGGHLALVGEVSGVLDTLGFISEKKTHIGTNYELGEAIRSSLNSKNFFQLMYTLNRQYGGDGIYKHTTMVNFLDNHNMSRFATTVTDRALLPLGWGILFGIPGVPHIYCGSDWGVQGRCDPENYWIVRPAFEKPEWNYLTDFIQKVSSLRRTSPALKFGDCKMLFATKEQLIFSRTSCGQTIIIALNLSEYDYNVVPKEFTSAYAAFEGLYGNYKDLISENNCSFDGSVYLPPKSIQYLEKVK